MTKISGETLRQIREDMKRAVAHDNADLALQIVKLIREHDLYVSQPSSAVDYVKLITSTFPAVCQACRANIAAGTEVMWARSLGCWHVGCYDEVLN